MLPSVKKPYIASFLALYQTLTWLEWVEGKEENEKVNGIVMELVELSMTRWPHSEIQIFEQKVNWKDSEADLGLFKGLYDCQTSFKCSLSARCSLYLEINDSTSQLSLQKDEFLSKNAMSWGCYAPINSHFLALLSLWLRLFQLSGWCYYEFLSH